MHIFFFASTYGDLLTCVSAKGPRADPETPAEDGVEGVYNEIPRGWGERKGSWEPWCFLNWFVVT